MKLCLCVYGWKREELELLKKKKHKKQTLHGVTCAKAHDAKPRFNL